MAITIRDMMGAIINHGQTMKRFSLPSILKALVTRAKESPRIETGSVVSLTEANSSAVLLHQADNSDRDFVPVRDPQRARRLSRIATLAEVATMIEMIATDSLSSSDGDDNGFRIPDTLANEVTPVDQRVQAIGNAVIGRVLTDDRMVSIIQELMEGGDSFRSLAMDNGLSKVIRLKELPPWEMFRIEDADGLVEKFEQRQWASDGGARVIHPAVCVHWRFRRNKLYGRALFEEMYDDAESLATGYSSLDRAVISTGVNPNVHHMPEGTDKTYCAQYRRMHEQKLATGQTMTDYYIPGGTPGAKPGNVSKMSDSWNPDVTALLENVIQRRRRFAMQGRTAPYLLGLETGKGQDISGQPALARARFINSVRSALTTGIRHVVDVELALNGIYEADYRIQWPKIYVDTLQNVVAENGSEAE